MIKGEEGHIILWLKMNRKTQKRNSSEGKNPTSLASVDHIGLYAKVNVGERITADQTMARQFIPDERNEDSVQLNWAVKRTLDRKQPSTAFYQLLHVFT